MRTLVLTTLMLGSVLSLSACGYSSTVEMFPGMEAEAARLCGPNGGLARGSYTSATRYYYRSTTVQTYSTIMSIECTNGARITRTYSRPGESR